MAREEGIQRFQDVPTDQEQEAMPDHLENLKSKEDWDEFFTRHPDESFEWCADWQHFNVLLTENLLWNNSELCISPEKRPPSKKPAELRILVPGCGISALSESLYDAGFVDIMNVDFSELVIERMLRKNWRERPEMIWRVMDITCLQQFGKESFDAVVDKGGLDALMEGSFGPRLGNLYLSEVKRVVSLGGKYIIITFASSYTIDILLKKFRFGWDWKIYAMPRHRFPEMQSFMVVVGKCLPNYIGVLSRFKEFSVDSLGFKARKLNKALEKEAKIRDKYLSNKDVIMYTLDDLRLGVRGDISVLEPGRRIKVILGEPGVSRFSYYGILIDAKPDSGEFKHQYVVYITNQVLKRDPMFTELAECLRNASRSLLVILDSSNSFFSLDDIHIDLTPLAKQLTPAFYGDPIFWHYSGIQQRENVCEVVSDVTGPIVVDDVIYKTLSDADPRKNRKHRLLIFKRAENLVQSEAPLSKKGYNETDRDTKHEASSGG